MALYDLPDDYDLDVLAAALRYVDNRHTAVDAGAHRGIWTHELLNHFEHVYSFEPVYDLYARIDSATKFQVALGAEMGRCAIAEGDKNTGQGHVVDGDSIIVMPLDSFGFRNVGFLKIDVEGYELNVLHGAKALLNACHPVLLIEENGLSARYGVADDSIQAFLSRLGYKRRENWGKDNLYST